MIDVGGQRSERVNWLPCFQNVTSVIFCVALSEYDQVLEEDPKQNRLHESLLLFESLFTSPWFTESSVILFLNKLDIFRQKLVTSPMGGHFPEYTGGPDVKTAAKFILDKFRHANRRNLDLYPHLTQATDTSNIRLVFSAIQATLIQKALRDTGTM